MRPTPSKRRPVRPRSTSEVFSPACPFAWPHTVAAAKGGEEMAEARVALAFAAAVVGAGFASGREIATFFTNCGSACWWGVGLCCALVGAGVSMLVKLSSRTGAVTLPQLYSRVMDARCGEAVQVAYSLLLLVVSSAMLSAAGELGALAVSSRYARPAGYAFALAVSLFAAKNPRSLSLSGAAVAAITLVYYIALCFAPVGEADTAVRGSAPVSMALGTLYAALQATLAGGVICATGRGVRSPAKAGLFSGVLLFALLTPACFALLRSGSTDGALPSVSLASAYGTAGFAMSLIMLFVGVATTLGATLYCLREQLLLAGLREPACMPVSVMAALFLSVVGFAPIVDVGYPLLGFLCALLLPALAAFL